MRTGRGIGLLDTYNWLPPYGESAVNIYSQGLNYVVEIEYDSENACSGADLKIKLIFESACSVYEASFPGAEVKGVEYGMRAEGVNMHTLIEYPESEVALSWEKYLGGDHKIKHYKILFLSENIQVEVLAKGFTMEGPFTIESNEEP